MFSSEEQSVLRARMFWDGHHGSDGSDLQVFVGASRNQLCDGRRWIMVEHLLLCDGEKDLLRSPGRWKPPSRSQSEEEEEQLLDWSAPQTLMKNPDVWF